MGVGRESEGNMTSLTDNLESKAPVKQRKNYGPLMWAVALVIGGTGLTLAGWTVYDNTRPVGRPKSASDFVQRDGPGINANAGQAAPASGERQITATRPGARNAMGDPGQMPLMPVDVSFTPVNSADDAATVVTALSGSIGEQTTKIDGLTATPLQTSNQVNEAVKNFLGPLVQGDIKDGPTYLAANGATPPETGPYKAVLDNIAKLLKFCDLDTQHIKVRRAPKIEGPGANMMPKMKPGQLAMSINQMQRDDGQSVSSLMMPLSGLLPGADDGVVPDGPRIEVLIPAKLKEATFAEKPFQIGLIMGQNPARNKWVPLMLQFHTSDMDTVKAISKVIRPAQRSGGDGAPAPKAPSDGPR